MVRDDDRNKCKGFLMKTEQLVDSTRQLTPHERAKVAAFKILLAYAKERRYNDASGDVDKGANDHESDTLRKNVR